MQSVFSQLLGQKPCKSPNFRKMLDTYSYPLKCFWTFIGLKLIWSVKVKVLVTKSCPTLYYHGLQPAGLFCPWNSTVKNTGMGYHSLLQGIFPTQWSNSGLLHCRQILYLLSHQGSLVSLRAKAFLSCDIHYWAAPKGLTGWKEMFSQMYLKMFA